MTRLRVLAAGTLASLALGCHKAPPEAGPPPVAVTAAGVGRADVAETLTLRGRLVSSPEEDVTLAPQVPGRLVELAVRAGDRVEKGALLARVDVKPLEDAERTAAAAAVKAREDEGVKKRAAALTESLFGKGISSAEERDNDRAAFESAHAARVDAEVRLAQASRQLGWAELRAPFPGVAAQVLRHAGEVVDGTAATPVLRLLGTSVQEVSADATPADLARVAVGNDATVSVPGGSRALPGRVVRVARAVDPASGVGEVRARLTEKSPAPLLSSTTMTILLAVHRGVVAVSTLAIRRSDAGTDEVVVVEKGAAKVRPIRTGLRSSGLTEVLEGLSVGETVVVDSPLGLSDGTPLTVRPAAGG